MKMVDIVIDILPMLLKKFIFRTENLPPFISVIVRPNTTLEPFMSARQGPAKLWGAESQWPCGCCEQGVALSHPAMGSAGWPLRYHWVSGMRPPVRGHR